MWGVCFLRSSRSINRASATMAEQQGEFLALSRDLDYYMKLVKNTVTTAAHGVDTIARSVETQAQSTSRQASAMASAALQASGNVQSVATAAEELSSSINEIGHQVGRAAEVAGKAVHETKRTSALVGWVVHVLQPHRRGGQAHHCHHRPRPTCSPSMPPSRWPGLAK